MIKDRMSGKGGVIMNFFLKNNNNNLEMDGEVEMKRDDRTLFLNNLFL